MTSQFSIGIEWLGGTAGTPGVSPPIVSPPVVSKEIRETAALMNIVVGGETATRFEDSWSKSVQRSARVSAYPLALWIASSWWRLRWEPLPFRTQPDTSWRMAHEMPAAGYGYLWPPLTFASDGETVDATCRPSHTLSGEPVRYLADFREAVEAKAFTSELDAFLELVLARLNAVGLPRTDLHLLWDEVLTERRDPLLALSRKLEAALGFEPDDLPEALLSRFLTLSDRAGRAAAVEIALACAGSHPSQALDGIEALTDSAGTEARFDLPPALRSPALDGSATPWDQGRQLALRTRHEFGLASPAVTDRELAGMLAIPAEVLQQGPALPVRPLGLGIRNESNGVLKLLFRKRNRLGLRFEAARFLGDRISTPAEEKWLPVTDARTARQKAQRAFAIELLCPFAALEEYLGHDYSPESVEAAGEFFGVSELAVRSHLANHGRIPFDAITA